MDDDIPSVNNFAFRFRTSIKARTCVKRDAAAVSCIILDALFKAEADHLVGALPTSCRVHPYPWSLLKVSKSQRQKKAKQLTRIASPPTDTEKKAAVRPDFTSASSQLHRDSSQKKRRAESLTHPIIFCLPDNLFLIQRNLGLTSQPISSRPAQQAPARPLSSAVH